MNLKPEVLLAVVRDAAPYKSGNSARIYFFILAVVVLLPALVLGAWLAWRSAAAERTQIEQGIHQKTKEIVDSLDRDIISSQNLLTALARSYALRDGNFEAFYRQAAELSKQLKIQIVLQDMQQNEQVLNTAFPWGTSLKGGPSLRPEVRDELLRTKRPFISNVIFGTLTKRLVVAIAVPVEIADSRTYMLGISIPVDNIAAIFSRTQFDARFVGTIIDRDETIIARSEKHSEFAGKRLPAGATDRMPGTDGTLERSNLEGIAFHWNYRRSEISGWFVVVGVPERVLTAPSNLVIASFTTLGGALFFIALGLAHGIGGRISAAIRTLNIAATALKNHEPVVPAITALREANEVSAALSIAAQASNTQRCYARSACDIGTWKFEIQKNKVTLSDRFTEITGVSKTADLKLSDLVRHVYAEDRDFVVQRFKECLAGNESYEAEFRIVTAPKRQPRWVSAKGRVDCDNEGKPVVIQGIIQNVTDRKHAEQERDDLRRRLMQAQEVERLRLARELHDQSGQSIVAALLGLKAIEPFVNQDGQDQVRSLRDQLDNVGKVLNRVARELRPVSIEELGLKRVLTDYVEHWSDQANIEADFFCNEPNIDRFSEETRTVIYRVVQESLTNVVKHAIGARSVSVIIDRAGQILRLTIEDDGQGFDASAFTGHSGEGGLGLAGMRERLSLVDGSLEIESAPGAGTTVFARIRLQLEEVAA